MINVGINLKIKFYRWKISKYNLINLVQNKYNLMKFYFRHIKIFTHQKNIQI